MTGAGSTAGSDDGGWFAWWDVDGDGGWFSILEVDGMVGCEGRKL